MLTLLVHYAIIINMKNILIRKVPEDVHEAFRILCIRRKSSMNEELLKLIQKEVEKAAKKD